MKVAIAAAGRFHAIRLAQQMEKRSSLERLFTGSIVPDDYGQLHKAHVTHSKMCALIDHCYFRLRLNKIITPSTVHAIKDRLFDHFVERSLLSMPDVDIFVAWAHYCLGSMSLIKKKSRILMLESGSSHILEQEHLLREEYELAGLLAPPITQANKERMCQEYELADYIMTPSRFVADGFVRRGIAREKILTVACGSDTSFFTQELHGGHDVMKESKKFTVIFVGLICLRKGIRVLLEAWKQVKKSLGQAHLVLVGTVLPDAAPFVNSVRQDSTITLTGPVSRERLKKLYADATVFVLPSIEDGFGMVMAEAMAMGLPVIATRNTGAPDIITSGIEGFILASGAIEELSKAIIWCGEHRSEVTMMSYAAQQKSKLFTWDLYGDQVFNTYQKILENA